MESKEPFASNVNRSGIEDKISPFKIAVLVFIREFCLARLAHLVSKSENNVEFSAQQSKDFCLLSIELIQSHDMTWEEFDVVIQEGNYDLPESIVANFYLQFKQIAKNGVTDLFNLAENLEKLLIEPAKGKPMIRRDSVLGIFIRKMVLQLDKLSFESTIELSKELNLYIDPSKHSEDPIELIKVSRRQGELLVSRQLMKLQHNEGLAFDANYLEKIISGILNENKDFAEAYYLAHLNALRTKDFGLAEEKLHNAYDQGTTIIESIHGSKREDTLFNNKLYRHAAFNLAVLYASFGYHQLAIMALNEAVALSSESADYACLQQVLAWFCKLEDGCHTKQKMLERLFLKSSELNLHSLASFALQMWSQSCALAGVKPSRVFDYLHASDVTNCQHALTDMVLSSLALRSAIWNFYGHPANSLQISQTLLTLHTGDPTRGNIHYDNENIHASVCNIAQHLSRHGKYREAECIIKYAAMHYSPFQQHSHLWKLTDLHISFYRTLWLAQWDKTESIVAQLTTFDVKESLCKKAHLLLCKGDILNCHIVLNQLEEKILKPDVSIGKIPNYAWETSRNLRLHVQLLIIRSALYCSQNVFSEALDSIYSALDICLKHHMTLQLALVSFQLAEIQFQMNLVANALELINKHMNTVYTHGSLWEQGLAIFLRARCLLTETKTASIPDTRARKQRILPILNQAKKMFNRMEAFYFVKDVVYHEALLYHHLGYEKERNTAAMLFRQLEEQHPIKSCFNIIVFVGL